jgi:hypothetical protein
MNNQSPSHSAVNVPQTTDQADAGIPAVQTPRRAPLTGGGMVKAIVPQDVEQAFRLASAICAANMAPKSYQRDANAVMVGILHGMEVGFTPMAALQSIAVINGMPSIWGDGALGLIQASGLLEDMKEYTTDDPNGGLVAHCELKRRGRAEWIKQQFSWTDAKTAKLTGKDTYQQYGRRMLQRRARAWAMTDGFADVLRGLHIREMQEGGELESGDDGNYRAASARPQRAAVALHAEDVDSGQAAAAARAMDRQFADTMADTPKTATAPITQPGPDAAASSASPEATGAKSQESADHSKIVAVILDKIEKVGTAKGLDNLISVTFAEDIDLLRTEAEAEYAKLQDAIAAKRKWFAR